MHLTLHATRRAPHGASRLVQTMSALSAKTRRAPSRRCRDASAYGHTTTAMHDIEYAPPGAPDHGSAEEARALLSLAKQRYESHQWRMMKDVVTIRRQITSTRQHRLRVERLPPPTTPRTAEVSSRRRRSREGFESHACT